MDNNNVSNSQTNFQTLLDNVSECGILLTTKQIVNKVYTFITKQIRTIMDNINVNK